MGDTPTHVQQSNMGSKIEPGILEVPELNPSRVHEDIKLFKCKICDESFARNSDLVIHSADVHEEKKPYRCKVCDENFTKNCELMSRVSAIHEGKKPFNCDKVTKLGCLNILTLNVCGLNSYGLIDQVKNLLSKYKISVAVLTETEISHEIAETFNIEGYTVFCPPSFTTGPKGKEAGLIVLVSNDVAIYTSARPDLNNKTDTIPTVWIHLKNNENLDFIIGGVYRRSRTSADVMKSEFNQLQQQILSAAQTRKSVLVLGDLNVDHNNPQHILTNEANDLLAVVEAANMQHMSNLVPTWKSYGLHKVCKCRNDDCGCLKRQRYSCIDNAYINIEAKASLQVLEDAITDHFPLLIKLETCIPSRNKLKSIWRRDTSKIKAFE